jgi:hypothetical protein
MELLGLNNDDDRETVAERLEEMRFALKNEVLQKYMVPMLLRKKDPQIEEYMQAEALVLGSSLLDAASPPESWNSLPKDRIAFLEQYESRLSELKLRVMQACSFTELKGVVDALVVTQEYYMALFKLLFNEFAEALPEEVNSREIIDTGKLLQVLRQGEIDNKTAWAIEREITRIDRIHGLKSAS